MKYPWKMQDEGIDPELDALVTRGLERRVEPAVPADFAARVARSLPPMKPARPVRRLGRMAVVLAMVVLTAILFALAPHATASFTSVAFDMELLVLAELGGIAYWVTVRRGV